MSPTSYLTAPPRVAAYKASKVGAVVNGMQRRDPMQGHAAQAGGAARLSTTNGNSRSVNVRYSSIGG